MSVDILVSILVPIMVALIASIPGSISLWKQAKLEREKAKLEQDKQPQLAIHEGITASQAAATIIRQYSDEVREMRAELVSLNEEVSSLKKQVMEKDILISEWQIGIRRLIAQVTSMDHTPVWEPKPRQSP